MDVLVARKKAHGDYADVARTSQHLKAIMRTTRNWRNTGRRKHLCGMRIIKKRLNMNWIMPRSWRLWSVLHLASGQRSAQNKLQLKLCITGRCGIEIYNGDE